MLFGVCTPAGMVLSDAGHFVEHALLGLHDPAHGIEIDTHVIMPDHLHAIFHLGTHPEVDPGVSISDLVHRLKMRVFKSWPGGVRGRGWPRYEEHLWHPSFYDALIEHERHLDITRDYILANPARWREKHHPE